MPAKIKCTILGSGDTLGTPIAGCKCVACLDPKSKRYRFGLLLEIDGLKILIDPNPDLKWECLNSNFELKDIDHIFVTHHHSDHINGLGEFFYRRPTPQVLWYGDNPLNHKLMNYWKYLEAEQVLEFRTFNNFEDIKLNENVTVLPIELNHGFPASGFIFKYGNAKIAIVTDTNEKLIRRTIESLKDVDVLFADTFSENKEQIEKVYIDCGIPTPDLDTEWFHMTINDVKDLKIKTGAKKVYTIHMSRHMDTQDNLVKKYQTDDFIIGYDNLSFNLIPQ
jgi:phosphoribosyl 1,2-cyclic phosphate phosphodiesterase